MMFPETKETSSATIEWMVPLLPPYWPPQPRYRRCTSELPRLIETVSGLGTSAAVPLGMVHRAPSMTTSSWTYAGC
jgi:hypothetical protein